MIQKKLKIADHYLCVCVCVCVCVTNPSSYITKKMKTKMRTKTADHKDHRSGAYSSPLCRSQNSKQSCRQKSKPTSQIHQPPEIPDLAGNMQIQVTSGTKADSPSKY
ncbi:unnamed protein product [Camellia sinensis]